MASGRRGALDVMLGRPRRAGLAHTFTLVVRPCVRPGTLCTGESVTPSSCGRGRSTPRGAGNRARTRDTSPAAIHVDGDVRPG